MKKPVKRKSAPRGNVIILSSQVICFHKDFYCIGFDHNKVAKGIADNRDMRSVDTSRNWNPGMSVCKKLSYDKYSRSEIIKMNKEIWCITEIKPKK